MGVAFMTKPLAPQKNITRTRFVNISEPCWKYGFLILKTCVAFHTKNEGRKSNFDKKIQCPKIGFSFKFDVLKSFFRKTDIPKISFNKRIELLKVGLK